MSPLYIYCSWKIDLCLVFSHPYMQQQAASRLKVPATIKANFQTPHIEELQGAEAPSCALTKSKRKIKSVAALLSSFFKTIFYNSIFFCIQSFHGGTTCLLFYGQALAISSVVGWSLMAVALKKYTFLWLFCTKQRSRQHYTKSNGVVAITGESERTCWENIYF